MQPKRQPSEHGVGAVLAFTLIALLPELGKMSLQAVRALAIGSSGDSTILASRVTLLSP